VLLIYQLSGGRWFYPLFAILVTCSVQMVGLYLVFAGLVMPALATDGQPRSWLRGSLLGGAAYIGGFVLSYSLDLPTGPAVVVALALSAIIYRVTTQKLS
jgi:zinc/manganese transport system permease protein